MHKLNMILDRVEALQKELVEELNTKHDELKYTIQEKTVLFNDVVKRRHVELAATWSEYAYDSGILISLTIPLIWAALIPVFFLDLFVSAYQSFCFPIYGIPRVKRSEYVIIDRHSLQYLSWLEKINCMYCGYFNGVISYIREVAARTEQYWCPIRHARPMKSVHSRYRKFFEYGDGKAYRSDLPEVREDFDDVE